MINRKRKALSLLLAVVMIFTIWMLPNGKAYVDAASLTGKQRALRAYKEFLSKPTVPIIPVGKRYYNLDRCMVEYYTATPSSQVRFSLAYINNDNIPELIVERMEECWRHGLYGVFTYKNGKVTRLRSGGGEDYYIGCYTKTGTFLTRMITEGTPYNDHYTVFKNGKVTKRLIKSVMSSKEITYYKYRNGHFPIVSKSSFMSAFRYYTKGKSLTKASFHKNAAWSRNMYLK